MSLYKRVVHCKTWYGFFGPACIEESTVSVDRLHLHPVIVIVRLRNTQMSLQSSQFLKSVINATLRTSACAEDPVLLRNCLHSAYSHFLPFRADVLSGWLFKPLSHLTNKRVSRHDGNETLMMRTSLLVVNITFRQQQQQVTVRCERLKALLLECSVKKTVI